MGTLGGGGQQAEIVTSTDCERLDEELQGVGSQPPRLQSGEEGVEREVVLTTTARPA